MIQKDYYKILGVSRTSKYKEVKLAYRSLALKYHPDKNKSPDANAMFLDISEAYQVLKDPTKKFKYDRLYDVQILNKNVTKRYDRRNKKWEQKVYKKATKARAKSVNNKVDDGWSFWDVIWGVFELLSIFS